MQMLHLQKSQKTNISKAAFGFYSARDATNFHVQIKAIKDKMTKQQNKLANLSIPLPCYLDLISM